MRKNNDNTIAISPLQRVQIQRPELGMSFAETYKLTIRLNEGRNESPGCMPRLDDPNGDCKLKHFDLRHISLQKKELIFYCYVSCRF